MIDDGSTDETPKILDWFSTKDKRIRVIHQNNIGLVETRNRGIQIATGEYITFVDGDDSIEVNMYERLLQNALKYQADISHCGVTFCFSDGHEESHYDTGRVVVQNNYEGLRDLLEGEFIEPAVWNKLYKKSLIKDSCLDASVLNNEDLLRNFVLFSRSSKNVYEDFCGYRYFQREGSMSKNASKQVQIEKHIFHARKIIVEQSSEEIYPYAMRSWISAMVNAINGLMYSKDQEAQEYCQECRKILKKERNHFQYLIRRQQIAANLILISPKLHRIVYGIYKKRIERRK